MTNWTRDIRFAFRTLNRGRNFALAVVVTLAVTIGLNTCIFNIFHAILLRQLPFEDSARLVAVWSTLPPRLVHVVDTSRNLSSVPNFLDWKKQNHVFEGMTAFVNSGRVTVSGSDSPEQVEAIGVCEDFFSVLGVRPVLGRSFSSREHTAGEDHLVILSNRYWRNRFGSDPRAIGRTLLVNQVPHVVVGVLPASFCFGITFPAYRIDNEPDLCTPHVLGAHNPNRGNNILFPLARLKRGVTVEQADAEMKLIMARLEKQYPQSNTGFGAEVVDLQESMYGRHRSVLLLVFAAGGLVLLIASINVANLLLNRAIARQNEFALRTSIGASRACIMRQLLTEGLVYSVLGGGLGLLLAWVSCRLVDPFLHSLAKGLPAIEMHWPILYFNLSVSILVAVTCSLAPIWQLWRTSLSQGLKQGTAAASGPAGRHWLASGLVVGQVALALLLLIGGGLLVRSFLRLMEVDPGYRPERLIAVEVPPTWQEYSDPVSARAFYQRLLESLGSLPGVDSAALSTALPTSITGNRSFRIEGSSEVEPHNTKEPGGEIPNADYQIVSGDYFHTVGIGVKRGRVFTEQDDEDSLPVVVINETMARKYWPESDPIDRRIFPDKRGLTVVGVVQDVRQRGLQSDPAPHMYLSYRQSPRPVSCLLVRSKMEPAMIAGVLRREAQKVDPTRFMKVRIIEEEIYDSLTSPRLIMRLLGAFACLALVLALCGVYGVVSCAVSRSRREMGIRVALGATRGQVLRRVLGYGLRRLTLGIVIGLAAAFPLTDLISSQLFGITPTDPWTFSGVSILLVLAGLLACYVPASRAARTNPVEVLKAQ